MWHLSMYCVSVDFALVIVFFGSRDSTAAGQTADALLCGTGMKSVVDVPFELTFMRPAPPVYSCEDDVRYGLLTLCG